MSSYQQDRDEFIAAATRDGFSVDDARLILRHAATIQRLAVAACNRELRPIEQRRDDSASGRIKAIAGARKVEVDLNGDPRGACVKVRFRNTPGNSSGGDGWYCVPTRRY